MAEEKQYDDTDKGVLWKPRKDQTMRGVGKINSYGIDTDSILVRQENMQGEAYYGLYQKIGTMYPREEGANENAPNFSGPFGDKRRVAMWINTKPNSEETYLKIQVQDKQDNNIVDMSGEPQVEDQSETPPKEEINEETIPF
jgi:hypothetical protein